MTPEIAALRAERDALQSALDAVRHLMRNEMAHWPTCPAANDFTESGWGRCDCHMTRLRAILPRPNGKEPS